MESFQTTLRRIAVADERLADELRAEERARPARARLHPRVRALVQIGALAAVDASPQSYATCVEAAVRAGASPEEVVGALVAVVPIVGLPRVVAAAPGLSLALSGTTSRSPSRAGRRGSGAGQAPGVGSGAAAATSSPGASRASRSAGRRRVNGRPISARPAAASRATFSASIWASA